MCCHTLQSDRKFLTLASSFPVSLCMHMEACICAFTCMQHFCSGKVHRLLFHYHEQNALLSDALTRIWVSNGIQYILALGTQETAGGKKVTALAHFTFLLKRKGWKSMTPSSLQQVIGLPSALPCKVWVRTICILSILDATLQIHWQQTEPKTQQSYTVNKKS